jgi:hypothetical protein
MKSTTKWKYGLKLAALPAHHHRSRGLSGLLGCRRRGRARDRHALLQPASTSSGNDANARKFSALRRHLSASASPAGAREAAPSFGRCDSTWPFAAIRNLNPFLTNRKIDYFRTRGADVVRVGLDFRVAHSDRHTEAADIFKTRPKDEIHLPVNYFGHSSNAAIAFRIAAGRQSQAAITACRSASNDAKQ